MRRFDYSFLDNGLLPANLTNLTALIYSFKTSANIRKEEFNKIYTELEKVAKVQSVKSSNAIEGIITSDERINEIVNKSSKPLNHNEAEIAGYRDALNKIHLEYKEMDFTEETILNLHEILMAYTAYEFDVGKYISFEEQINNMKSYYYDSLEKSSKGWKENQNEYVPFIQNFLSTLYMCYKELDKRFNVVNSNKITKTSRIEETVLNSVVPISKSEICGILPDVSPTTVEAVLGKMVRENKITRIGIARNSKYIKNMLMIILDYHEENTLAKVGT